MDKSEDIVDVEFETVSKTRSQGRQASDQARISQSNTDQQDDEQLAIFGKRDNRAVKNNSSMAAFSLAAAACMVVVFYFSGGHVLFNKMFDHQSAPKVEQTALVQPQDLLRFKEVDFQKITRNGSTFLTVRATIANNDKVPRNVPAIMLGMGNTPNHRITIRANRGEILNPGERLIFTNTVPTGDTEFTKPHLSFLD